MPQAYARKGAEPPVVAAHRAALAELPFGDRQDFEDAARGFVGTIPDAAVTAADGRVIWSLAPYRFLEADEAPDTVHPSLWRLAQLNCRHGLFEVAPRIYQVRGFDIANMTIVEGDTGLIVIDTLTTAETARAALELYRAHRGPRPVKAVIYTHTHSDHWGGVKGVVDEAAVASGAVAVIAPDGFMEHAVSENVIAGNAMLRRAHYQFGMFLDVGVEGQVDAALGKSISRGTVTLIAPTDLVRETGETRTVDGVEMVFQMAPNSEAPAEFHIYFPAFRALNLAENATHLFHNLLPFRGAEVRDPLAWSKYINEAIELFASRSDVLMGQHHWPVWGQARLQTFLRQARDLYKYVHDQTLRLMNHGLTAAEIAETLTLPDTLARPWHNRGYYGTVRHNAKAIYQKYLGWFDGNPANLDPLPPVETARSTIDYMGGADAVLRRAREDFAAGRYRWVAQVTNQVVFAEPGNQEARALNADAFEQLGYLAEAATWRNAYLFAAQELRRGPTAAKRAVGGDPLKALTIDMVFDFLGVRLNGQKAQGKAFTINWVFTDPAAAYTLTLENSALSYLSGRTRPDADATLSLTRATLDAVISRRTTFLAEAQAGRLKADGNLAKLAELASLFDDFTPDFAIVEP
ncbi:alkyl/aryl-sulfatase [Chelatococcus reniformis]|uniref:Linear primary-alkylsulfatase n=1 Tax=Chelatococcus reniformis TaxID=1494448 RepID=A0A916U5R8_9HYPH|nr:alkyl sulfatase dimerization domain-containing protein [Chelatococcus reniformis]GGC59847.1 alkyl sulfatase [Chelatococcus reniformis]